MHQCGLWSEGPARPYGTWHPLPGGVAAQFPASRGWHPFQPPACFPHGRGFPWNAGKHDWSGKVQVSSESFWLRLAEAAMRLNSSWPWRATRLSSPELKPGASAGVLVGSQPHDR
jgi:hypothetical protein